MSEAILRILLIQDYCKDSFFTSYKTFDSGQTP